MNRRISVLLLLVLLPGMVMLPGTAVAQPAAPPPTEEPLPRWDTSGSIGWRGARIDATEYNGGRWDARFVYSGTLGYYWTANLKLEMDVSATTPSTYDTFEARTIEGVGYPLFVRTDHRITAASFGGLVIYQFFENVAFHPFVGAGGGVASRRERITTQRQTQVVGRAPDVFDTVVIAEEQSAHDDRSDGFGQVIAGFKTYPSERVFFRSDVLWSAGAGRSHEMSWRLGFGVDF